jgi:hypothetical protein
MSLYQSADYTTETGEQTLLAITRDSDVTVVIEGTAGSDDIDLQFTLDNPKKSGVERFTIEEDVISSASPYIKTFEGPISGIGINIQTNISNDISLRVLQAHRGG